MNDQASSSHYPNVGTAAPGQAAPGSDAPPGGNTGTAAHGTAVTGGKNTASAPHGVPAQARTFNQQAALDTASVAHNDSSAHRDQNGHVSGAPAKKEAVTGDRPAMTQITQMTDSKHIEAAAPSDSHALAAASTQATNAETDHANTGAAQQIHDEAELKDLGWNEPVEKVPAPLVETMPNEYLWMLVRRFNKQMYHVKSIEAAPPGGLDLNIADDEEFSPDKLRSTIERLYMTVIIGMMGFANHIVRLRSWRETRRTAYFCTGYFLAWMLDLIVPTLVTLVLVLVVYPPARKFLFPPAPVALVDSKTGGVKTPAAGVLGSHDSATGAPENHQGEAVEQEAHNFVNSFASIALSSASGKHPTNERQDKEGAIDTSVPDPTSLATAAAESRNASSGGATTVTHDKTKQPMEEAMWTKIRPATHILANIADTWERFANALSPTPPFPKNAARLKLASALTPVLLISFFVTSYMFMKGVTFGIGFGFFGDPIMSRGLDFLNRKIPNWPQYLDIRNSLLKGVPTNAQLTVTLLRIGEANKAPLPPPPRAKEAPPDHTKPIDTENQVLPGDVHPDEAADAAAPDHDMIAERDAKADEPSKKKHGSRVLGFFKGTTKATVETVFTADHVKASLGSHHAKDRLGVLPNPKKSVVAGPVDFKARYRGKKGWIYISTQATTPCVGFTTENSTRSEEKDDLDPKFSIAISDVKELRKIGGLGWKSKLVVGWAMGSEVKDGLEIIDVKGNSHVLTAIDLRDELFNRLVAMGGQKWESW